MLLLNIIEWCWAGRVIYRGYIPDYIFSQSLWCISQIRN